ncbi:MAG: pyrroline-5-carboxylate reductase [Betaproteobacteria bacterium]|nr:pyrroline-5-carboxylate reductase [Betaproteobacteria bacterium]
MKIAFIGGGNMATALIGGLIAKGTKPSAISVVEVLPEARKRLAKKKVHASAAPDATTAAADTLVFAVKPQDMRAAAGALAGVAAGKLVISIAAGIRLAGLSRWLGGYRRLVRCMPNTPALIGAGVSCLCALPEVSAAERRRAERILAAAGKVVWVKDEALLDPVTAVSGSGPAYVFWFIEQLAAAGESLGLTREVSARLALETVLGSAKLAAQSADSASVLRARVTSKGGTTEAALKVFDEERLAERLRRAIEAASRRGAELGALLGKD